MSVKSPADMVPAIVLILTVVILLTLTPMPMPTSDCIALPSFSLPAIFTCEKLLKDSPTKTPVTSESESIIFVGDWNHSAIFLESPNVSMNRLGYSVVASRVTSPEVWIDPLRLFLAVLLRLLTPSDTLMTAEVGCSVSAEFRFLNLASIEEPMLTDLLLPTTILPVLPCSTLAMCSPKFRAIAPLMELPCSTSARVGLISI